MRIAITGAHGSGKTSLIDDFADRHRDYEREEEPYWALAQNGVPFADGVSLPDLEEQLAASVGMIIARADDKDVIFDRCPLDFIAYLDVVAEGQGIDWTPSGKLLARIERGSRRSNCWCSCRCRAPTRSVPPSSFRSCAPKSMRG